MPKKKEKIKEVLDDIEEIKEDLDELEENLDELEDDLEGLLEPPAPGTIVIQNTGRHAVHTGLAAPLNKIKPGEIKEVPEDCGRAMIDGCPAIELISE